MTDRQTDRGKVTLIAIGEITSHLSTMSPNNDTMISRYCAARDNAAEY